MNRNITYLTCFFMVMTCLCFCQAEADFHMHPVDMDVPGIHCISILDLDGDGDRDIIGGSEHTPYSTSIGIMWWRNDGGYPITWTRFMIDSTFLHVMSVDVGRIDDDEYPDIVASSWENGKICWWKNNGNPESTWISYEIVSGWVNPHDGVIADINGDGRNDVVGVSAGNNKISVFYNVGGVIPGWQENSVSVNFGGAKSVISEYLDNDSLIDLVGAGDGCDDIAWWKNLGGNPATWEQKMITTGLAGSSSLDAADMNTDNQTDIIATGWEGDEVAFWTCLDIGKNSWEKTLVTDQLDIAVNALGGDIDMDGDADIVAVGKVPGELIIFYRDGKSFSDQILSQDFSGGSALALCDADGDGDDDIIAGAGILKLLCLFENKTIVSEVHDVPGTGTLVAIPNPSDEEFSLRIHKPEGSPVLVVLSDPGGREIFRKKYKVSNNMIDISTHGLAGGIYLVRVLSREGIYQGKILKTH